jgi:hypothetical protein
MAMITMPTTTLIQIAVITQTIKVHEQIGTQILISAAQFNI